MYILLQYTRRAIRKIRVIRIVIKNKNFSSFRSCNTRILEWYVVKQIKNKVFSVLGIRVFDLHH